MNSAEYYQHRKNVEKSDKKPLCISVGNLISAKREKIAIQR